MNFSTRIAVAMVALAALTAVAVGWLSYRNVQMAVLPRTVGRIAIHVRLLATELAAYVRGAREDIVGFSSAAAVQGIVRARLAGGIDPADGTSEATWRQRMAQRFATELGAKQAYDQFRVVAADGRELVRVDRRGENAATRIVPDDQLQDDSKQSFFAAAIQTPADQIYVSPVEPVSTAGSKQPGLMPVLRIGSVIQTPQQTPFGVVIIDVDMRPIMKELAASAQPGGQIYLIDDRGNYLLHPDAAREFASYAGSPIRWQSEYPDLMAKFASSEATTTLVADPTGAKVFAGLAAVVLAGGPRAAVMEITPQSVLMAPAAAIGRSTLLVGAIAVLCAGLLAALLARSMTRPLVAMTRAVAAFPHDRTLAIPTGAAGEIGVLARAFARMTAEVKDKTASLEKEIAEHSRTEAALERHADRERLFGAAVQSSVDAVVTMTLDGIVTGWNPGATRLFGWASDDIVGRSIDFIVPVDRRAEVQEILAKIACGEKLEHHETIRLRRDGSSVEVSLSVSPISLPSGAVIGACKIARDVTERNAGRKLYEQEVNERRRVAEVLQNTITSMQDAVLVADAQTNILLANPAAQRLIGDIAGMAPAQWRENHELFMPDGVTPIAEEDGPLPRAVRGEMVENYEVVLRRKADGRLSWLVANGGPLQASSSDGTGGVVIYRDITETRETERQLRQAQKMEAVGQLTGGIAHDFNNILTVITGTIEILAEGVADRPELAAITKMVDEAAERGSELTRHLLAFSRRQPLQPRETDINALVLEAGRLFRPTLGGHIEVESMLDDDAAPALVDPNQLTTALLNLALNARDAMPHGGKLMLETGNVFLDQSYADMNAEVQPGHYVMIAVSDTGSGIPAALLDKVFDPFFTTKEVGKGTGLGLSMVYGFVKQSGGHIKIYSEEGLGTTVRMYLPRGGSAPKQVDDAAAAGPTPGGHEIVLIVEDDALVRKYAVAQVHALGYATLTATSAAEALALLDGGTAVDLLFTDVVMPGGIDGRQLAEQATKRRATLKVLFTSGYADNALIHHGRLDPGVLLLPKPYRRSDLARMIRSALAA